MLLFYVLFYVEEKHNDTKFYSCNICEKSFRNKVSMKNHMNTHEEMPKSYVCKDCGKAYKNKAHLKMHIDSVHKNIQRYSCDQCDFNFNSYNCNMCDKTL